MTDYSAFRQLGYDYGPGPTEPLCGLWAAYWKSERTAAQAHEDFASHIGQSRLSLVLDRCTRCCYTVLMHAGDEGFSLV